MEAVPFHLGWLPPFMALMARLAILAQWTGVRFLLFPPLVVIAFEMSAHAGVCPRAIRAWRLPLVCTAGAVLGVLVAAFASWRMAADRLRRVPHEVL
ncbi:MAG: hypothetical protein EPN49_06870 [Rhodanobacter sp.]|nr:MAG: hypothetical protein EPN49_06870 [Rhodanobacter sp.]